MKQTTFASLAWDGKKRVTRRERFLGEMDAVIPWARILGLIEPHYSKGESGRPPKPLTVMLRIYFMQQWFNLSDPQAEDGLYDSESMRRFAGLELADDAIPDEPPSANSATCWSSISSPAPSLTRCAACWKSAGCCSSRALSSTPP